MERTKLCLIVLVIVALGLFLPFPSRAEVEVGDYIVGGSLEVGGVPGDRDGSKAKFEEYRQVGVGGWVIPEIELIIGRKKEDFYMNFDATKPGFRDENYRLRFGRYGLFDVEAEWDQIPHLFSEDTARTPYHRDGGTFTLGSKSPSTTVVPLDCGATLFCNWLKDTARPIDLGLLYGIGRLKIRYTPTPGWTFSAGYWSQHVGGDRAFGSYFGPSPGAYNITELPEPIDYRTHNIELGGEYAGNGWSVGLKYNASLFHNNISTLIWDNPINLSNASAIDGSLTGACTETATYTNTSNGRDANRGPCRGRTDLYPSNQAHTVTLSGAASLPMKTRFMGTASYGWRFQDDKFLPFTINSAITQPSISAKSLNGDVRPLMINATLVNNFFDGVNLKAYYRLYDFDNRSRQISFAQGIILNDQAPSANCPTNPNPALQCLERGSKSDVFSYSKQNVGLDAAYDITRWLTVKAAYGWERMHRSIDREITNSDEHSVGPTFDIKPSSWLLFRASYRHFWRNAPGYHPDEENLAKKFDEAKRDRDKSSLFAQLTPWEQLMFYGGFEFMADRYPNSQLGTQNDFNYSPSVGALYAPLDWLKIFADYNWERFDWKLDAMQRSTACSTPADCPRNLWEGRGRDRIHTFSIGSDMSLIEKVLGLRVQYGYSMGTSQVHAVGDIGGLPPLGATNYPTINNQWHEFLARMEYQIHKNVALKFGYYFNRATERDVGVDMMQLWMGGSDQGSVGGNRNLGHSIFLGDRLKGPFTAHVGFVTLKFSF